jgi:hypothetical protein
MGSRRGIQVLLIVLLLVAGCLGQGQPDQSESGVVIATPTESTPEVVDPVRFSGSAAEDSAALDAALRKAQRSETLGSVGVNGSEYESLQSQLSSLPRNASENHTHYVEYNSSVYEVELLVDD